MGDRLELGVSKKPAGAFDRVDRAKDAGQQVAVLGVFFELNKVLIELSQVLVALDEKFVDQI